MAADHNVMEPLVQAATKFDDGAARDGVGGTNVDVSSAVVAAPSLSKV